MGCQCSKANHASVKPTTKKPAPKGCFGKCNDDDVSTDCSLSTTEDDKLIKQLPMRKSGYFPSNKMTFPRIGHENQSVTYGARCKGPEVLMNVLGRMESKLLACDETIVLTTFFKQIVRCSDWSFQSISIFPIHLSNPSSQSIFPIHLSNAQFATPDVETTCNA